MRINGFVLHGAVTVAVLASGVGAVVAGSSGGGVTLAGPQVLRLIQNAPAALSSYPAVKMSFKISVSGQGRHLSSSTHGVISPDGKRGTFVTSLPNGLGNLTFEAIDKTMYVHASPRAAASLGKQWVGLTLTTPSGWAPNQPSVGTDGLGFVHLMPGATGEVKNLGTARIEGVRTTHYRVSIDLQKAAAAEPPEMRTGSVSQLQAAGVTTEPFDVWLDHEGAPRQMSFSFDVQSVRLDFQLRLSGSTQPLELTAPPASDVYFVTSSAELFQQALQR